jgi:hypothetical protein
VAELEARVAELAPVVDEADKESEAA